MRRAAALALLVAAPLAVAAVPLTEAEAQHFRALAAQCSGGYYGRPKDNPDADMVLFTAADIARGLPGAGPQPRITTESGQDAYRIATALLWPALKPVDSAWAAKPWTTCPTDAAAGVRLLQWIVGEGGSDRLWPTNALFWLGLAARDGAGMPADAARARLYFLHARIAGLMTLGPEYWGESKDETLETALARPAARRLLDLEVAAGTTEAQLVLADLVARSGPKRARALIEAAAREPDYRTARRLAAAQLSGLGAPPDPVAAAITLALVGRQQGVPAYDEMIAAAVTHNGEPIPEATDKPTLDMLGGRGWLDAGMAGVRLDSLRGKVSSRGLLAPDGRVIFVEVTQLGLRRTSLGAATLAVYAPKRLPKLPPHLVAGRPVFAWVTLPTINWD